MFDGESLKGPRTRFAEWLLEKGEPLFAYLREEFGLSTMTVIGVPTLIFLIISIIGDLRKGKKPITEIIAAFLFLFAIIFGQLTLPTSNL